MSEDPKDTTPGQPLEDPAPAAYVPPMAQDIDTSSSPAETAAGVAFHSQMVG